MASRPIATTPTRTSPSLSNPQTFVALHDALGVHLDRRGERSSPARVAPGVLGGAVVDLIEALHHPFGKTQPGRVDARLLADSEGEAADGERVRGGGEAEVDVQAAVERGLLVVVQSPAFMLVEGNRDV